MSYVDEEAGIYREEVFMMMMSLADIDTKLRRLLLLIEGDDDEEETEGDMDG